MIALQAVAGTTGAHLVVLLPNGFHFPEPQHEEHDTPVPVAASLTHAEAHPPYLLVGPEAAEATLA